MDPTPDGTGAGAHPDEDRLADFAGGVLDPADADQVAAHVGGCATCAATVERIRSVQAVLATLPPVPMPPDVAARIDLALAAAADTPTDQPAATVLAPRRRRWTERLPGAAVAAALVAIVGAIGYGIAHDGSQNGGGAESGAGAAAPTRGSGSATPPPPLVVNRTGRHYTVESLRAAVPALLDGSSARSPQGRLPGAAGAPEPLASPAGIQACAQHLGGGDTPLLAVDYAFFRDRPAVILVYADEDPERVDILVGGPDCDTDPNPIPQFIVANR